MSQEESLLNSSEEVVATSEPQPAAAGVTAPMKLRAVILLLICFLTFGGYWIYDTPGAIQTQLKDYFAGKYDYAGKSNSLLYSVYSWPNVALAMCGGYIVDRILGIRYGMIAFISFINLGQLIFSIGIQTKTFYACVVGRFIFGLGGECLAVVQNTFVVRWFAGPYLSLVFGVVLAFARIGSSVNMVLTPSLAKNQSVPFAVWFGMGTCVLSLISALLLAALDYANRHYVEKQIVKPKDSEEEFPAPEIITTPTIQHEAEDFDPRDSLIASDSLGDVTEKAKGKSDEEEEEALPSLRQILDFKLEAWLLFALCVVLYLGIFVFYQGASKMMQRIHGYSEERASSILSIPNFVSIGATPLFGTILDRKGMSLSFLCIACLGLVSCHIIFLCNIYLGPGFFVNPIPIFIVFGFCYSLGAASLWPTLAFVVPKNILATGYGTMTAIQNLGLAVMPLIISAVTDSKHIKDTRDQYGVPHVFFVGFELIAFALTVYIRYRDACGTGLMDATATERTIIRERLELEAKEAARAAKAAEAAAAAEEGTFNNLLA